MKNLFLVLCFLLSTSRGAKASVDPYAVLGTATIAAYSIIALGGTAAVAGTIWTVRQIQNKEVAMLEAQDDALAYIANGYQAPSVLLSLIFEKTRSELAQMLSAEELSSFTDEKMAHMLIQDNLH
jgi:hypothetical protein